MLQFLLSLAEFLKSRVITVNTELRGYDSSCP